MSLEFPKNRKEITDRMKNDVRAELGKNSNPFLRNSALGSLIFGMAGRIFDFFSQLKFLLLNMFPDTATGDFLVRWGSYVKIGRLAASIATGKMSIEGTDSLPRPSIPDSTPFQSNTQAQYISIGDALVIPQITVILSLIRSGSVVTAKTNEIHALAPSMTVLIKGALEIEYNGSFEITGVPASDEFTYEITTAPPSPATGSIEASSTFADITVESVDFGTVANLDVGAVLSLINPIAGVNNSGNVQFEGIAGGEDIENDELFRERILERYQNPVSFFNVAEIQQKVKTLSGVTRVIVQEITPVPGAITVFFLKDNDPSIIPTAVERELAKEKILEIKPAHVDPNDIHVPPLAVQPILFAFADLVPNTASLQAAITANLRQLFRGGNNIGENMEEFVYRCVIADSFDNAGIKVKSFSLSSPIGTIIVPADSIAIFDDATFNF